MLIALLLDENSVLNLTGIILLGPPVLFVYILIYLLVKNGSSRSSVFAGCGVALLLAGICSCLPLDISPVIIFGYAPFIIAVFQLITYKEAPRR